MEMSAWSHVKSVMVDKREADEEQMKVKTGCDILTEEHLSGALVKYGWSRINSAMAHKARAKDEQIKVTPAA